MNFNIYLNNNLAKQLDSLIKRTKKKRNTIIQEAIAAFAQQDQSKQWPTSIQSFHGINGLTNWNGFESTRKDLKQPNTEIF